MLLFMMEKIRLDYALVERGLAKSRENAKELIKSGNVLVNKEHAIKAGMEVYPDCEIEVIENDTRFVSRGGQKLAKAIELYHIRLDNYVCMDIGASTGGFTDCMLQNGAKKIYAVDVGYGQLAESLKSNPKVINMEHTNIRYLDASLIEEKLDFATVDVSFISLTLVFPILKKLLKPGGEAVCLVKPQFEAGRERVSKKGVVHELKAHVDVLKKIYAFLSELGFCVKAATFSPVTGQNGNVEYLYYIKNENSDESLIFDEIEKMAFESHLGLKKTGGKTAIM